MEVEPSSVAGIYLFPPGTPAFGEALQLLLGHEPDAVLAPALPCSVIAENDRERAVALLGIRFDMVGPKAKHYAVIHYADTLRHPEKATFTPGARRFVCAEPLYTDLVLHRANDIDRRGPMNLATLRTMLKICASLDCVAFDDGQFEGPDTLGAFDRMEVERTAELALIDELLKPDCRIETALQQAMEIPAAQARDHALLARRVLARRLHGGLATGGDPEVITRALNHRSRIPLRRI